MAKKKRSKPRQKKPRKKAAQADAAPPPLEVAMPHLYRPIELAAIGVGPTFRPPHCPDTAVERAALRESFRAARSSYQLRLRDLIVMSAGPSGTHDYEQFLDDPENNEDETIATQALDGIADELEILVLALDSKEGTTDEHISRVLAPVYKRARAAAEFSRRTEGAPEFILEAGS